MFEKQWMFLDGAVGFLYNSSFEIAAGGVLKPLEVKEADSLTGVYEHAHSPAT